MTASSTLGVEAWAGVTIPEAGGAVQIGEAFDGTPVEGDQWQDTCWRRGCHVDLRRREVASDARWWRLRSDDNSHPDAGQPTKRAASGCTSGRRQLLFTAALSKVVTPEGEPIGPDLNDYYTSLEADESSSQGDYADAAHTPLSTSRRATI